MPYFVLRPWALSSTTPFAYFEVPWALAGCVPTVFGHGDGDGDGVRPADFRKAGMCGELRLEPAHFHIEFCEMRIYFNQIRRSGGGRTHRECFGEFCFIHVEFCSDGVLFYFYVLFFSVYSVYLLV